nr:hypothetical protein [Actinomycetota bacterium]
VLPRNVIAAFVPAMLVLGAGFAAHRAGPWLAAGLCALAAAVSIQVSFNESLQRDDWRGLADALGRAPGDRILVLNPQTHRRPLEHYAGPLEPLPPAGAVVSEVDAIFITREGPEREPEPPLAAFTEAGRASSPSWELRRLRAPEPLGVAPFRAEAGRLGEEPPFLALQRRR